MPLTFKEAKKKNLRKVYALDIYGGVDCFELAWHTDCVWLRDNLCDDYKGIKEFFDNNKFLYETLKQVIADFK